MAHESNDGSAIIHIFSRKPIDMSGEAPTPVEVLDKAEEIGKKGFAFPFIEPISGEKPIGVEAVHAHIMTTTLYAAMTDLGMTPEIVEALPLELAEELDAQRLLIRNAIVETIQRRNKISKLLTGEDLLTRPSHLRLLE